MKVEAQEEPEEGQEPQQAANVSFSAIAWMASMDERLPTPVSPFSCCTRYVQGCVCGIYSS